jgi:hypothetical protein
LGLSGYSLAARLPIPVGPVKLTEELIVEIVDMPAWLSDTELRNAAQLILNVRQEGAVILEHWPPFDQINGKECAFS